MASERVIMEAWFPWDEDRDGDPIYVRGQRTNGIQAFEMDRTVEVIMCDVAEPPVNAAEVADREYHGYDTRGIPTTDLFDGDISRFL